MDEQDDSLHAPVREGPAGRRRLDRLLRSEKRRGGGRGYSRFVRAMRLLLPLVAVGIVGIVVSWPRVEERLAPPPEAGPAPQAIGQNELINPRFESQDDKERPFTVTAARAVQSSANPDVVFLEAPVGEMTLRDGAGLHLRAVKGAYDQRHENLVLEGDVTLRHAQGYEIATQKLRLDMGPQTAWSDQEIVGAGPAGTLHATGVKADMAAGTVVFTGPAKLVLKRAVKGL